MINRMLVMCVVGCGVMAAGWGCRQDKGPGPVPVKAREPAPVVESAPLAGMEDDTVLVTVNDKSLTRRAALNLSVEAAMQRGMPREMVDMYLSNGGPEMEKQAVERFVDQTLLLAEVERRAAEVTEAEIDMVLAKLSEGLPEGMTLEEALAASGATTNDLRRDIVSNERLRKLFEAETADLADVTDEQVADFYKANGQYFTREESATVRHVLIRCEADADDATRAKAKEEVDAVRKQLEGGADFAEVAKEKSACPSASNGGDLGDLRRGQTVAPFEAAAFGQEIGTIGPVVETEFGYHVIQVTARKEAGTDSLESVSGQIREHLTSQAREAHFGAYVKTLREGADIRYGDAAK